MVALGNEYTTLSEWSVLISPRKELTYIMWFLMRCTEKLSTSLNNVPVKIAQPESNRKEIVITTKLRAILQNKLSILLRL